MPLGVALVPPEAIVFVSDRCGAPTAGRLYSTAANLPSPTGAAACATALIPLWDRGGRQGCGSLPGLELSIWGINAMARKPFRDISPSTYRISLRKIVVPRFMSNLVSGLEFAAERDDLLPVLIYSHNSLKELEGRVLIESDVGLAYDRSLAQTEIWPQHPRVRPSVRSVGQA